MSKINGAVFSLVYYLLIINIALIDLPRLGLYLFFALIYPALLSVVLKEGSVNFRIVFFFLSFIIAILAGLLGPTVIIQGGF